MRTLDLGLIGNSSIGALIDPVGEIVWMCLPRFDGDPVFCSLLRERHADTDFGFFAIDLVDLVRSEQEYRTNTALLLTRLYDRNGGSVEIVDFAPRFRNFGRITRPPQLVRIIEPVAGLPRITLRVRPTAITAARSSGNRSAAITSIIGPGVSLCG